MASHLYRLHLHYVRWVFPLTDSYGFLQSGEAVMSERLFTGTRAEHLVNLPHQQRTENNRNNSLVCCFTLSLMCMQVSLYLASILQKWSTAVGGWLQTELRKPSLHESLQLRCEHGDKSDVTNFLALGGRNLLPFRPKLLISGR